MASHEDSDNTYVPWSKDNNLHCPVCFEHQFFTSWQEHCASETHVTSLELFDANFERKGNRVSCNMCEAEFEWTAVNEHAKLHLLQPWHRPVDLYRQLFQNHTVLWRKEYYCSLCRLFFPNWFWSIVHFDDENHIRLRNKASLLIISGAPPIKPNLYEIFVKECFVPFDGHTVACKICKVEKIQVAKIPNHISSFYHWHFSTRYSPGSEVKPALGECSDCLYFQDYNKKYFLCALCDSLVPSLRDKTEIHLHGNAHVNSLKKYGCDKISIKAANKYHCRYCDSTIDGLSKLHRHVLGKNHADVVQMWKKMETKANGEDAQALETVQKPLIGSEFVCACLDTIECVANRGFTSGTVGKSLQAIKRSSTSTPASASINDCTDAVKNAETTAPASRKNNKSTGGTKTAPTCEPSRLIDLDYAYCKFCKVESFSNAEITSHARSKSHTATMMEYGCDMISWVDDRVYYCKCCECKIFGCENVADHTMGKRHLTKLNESRQVRKDQTANSGNLNDSGTKEEVKTPNSGNLNDSGTKEEVKTPNSCNLRDSEKLEEDQTSKSCDPNDKRKPDEAPTSKSSDPNDRRKPDEAQTSKSCEPNDKRKPDEAQALKFCEPNDKRKPDEAQASKSCEPNDRRKPDKAQTPKSCDPNDRKKSDKAQTPKSCDQNDRKKPDKAQTPKSCDPNDRKKPDKAQTPKSCDSKDRKKPDKAQTPKSCDSKDRKKPDKAQTPKSCDSKDRKKPDKAQTPKSCDSKDRKKPDKAQTPKSCDPKDRKKPDKAQTPKSCDPSDRRIPEKHETSTSYLLSDSQDDETSNPSSLMEITTSDEDESSIAYTLSESEEEQQDQKTNSSNLNASEKQQDEDRTTNPRNVSNGRTQPEDETPKKSEVEAKPEQSVSSSTCDPNDKKKHDEEDTEKKNEKEAKKLNRAQWTNVLSLMLEEFASLDEQLKLKPRTTRKPRLEMPIGNQLLDKDLNERARTDCSVVPSTSASLCSQMANRFTVESSLSQKDKVPNRVRTNSYSGKHQVESGEIAAALVPCKIEPTEDPKNSSYGSLLKPSKEEDTDNNMNYVDFKSELSMSFSICSFNSSDDENSSILTTDSQRKRRLPKRMKMQRIVKLLDFDKDYIYDMSDKLKEIELGIKLSIVREPKTIYCLVCRKNLVDEPQSYLEHLCSPGHSQYIQLMQKDHSLFENVTGQFSDLDLASRYMEEISEENLTCLVCHKDVANEDSAIEEHVEDCGHETACREMFINRKQHFEGLKSRIQSDWYNVGKYQCVPCFANFDSNINFVKHLESKKHAVAVANKSEKIVRTMVYDFCSLCALLWYGYRCTYAEHCNAPSHKWRLKGGHESLQPLPELAKNLLNMPDEFVEDTMNYVDSLADKEREKEETVIQDLERGVKSKFFNAKAYVFGSRTYGLYSPDSNLDVFLDCGTNYDGYVKSECLVQNLMTVVHQCLSKDCQTWDTNERSSDCRSAVIRVTHRATGLSCNISSESGLPVESSKLIKSFLDIFPPCRRLMLFLKQWLEFCNLSGVERISSYALCWLVIFYLQKETVVPSVATLIASNAKSRVIAGWEVGVPHKFTYHRDASNYNLKEFLARFFTFYADFDFRYNVACPLLGREIQKRTFGNLKELPDEMSPYVAYIENSGDPEPLRIDSPMCVQDPFDLQHNVTKKVSKVLLYHFRAYCSKSLAVL